MADAVKAQEGKSSDEEVVLPVVTPSPNAAAAEAVAKAAQENADKPAKKKDEPKIVRRFADGSSEWTTAAELEKDHGPAMEGPSTADLNPAYAEFASTHNGAAE